jgi:hypothetical protein
MKPKLSWKDLCAICHLTPIDRFKLWTTIVCRTLIVVVYGLALPDGSWSPGRNEVVIFGLN